MRSMSPTSRRMEACYSTLYLRWLALCAPLKTRLDYVTRTRYDRGVYILSVVDNADLPTVQAIPWQYHELNNHANIRSFPIYLRMQCDVVGQLVMIVLVVGKLLCNSHRFIATRLLHFSLCFYSSTRQRSYKTLQTRCIQVECILVLLWPAI